ncbi:MAG: hypothetical protein M1832_004804 [Thelocarpon impressellum]|nr:MAG: hypothetical protein M1832_004804 [Thelocarpon impressellum]
MATRVTLALNARQSQKTPLLLPKSTADPRTLILKASHSKLRLKKGSRIFEAGTGREVLGEDDWRGVLRDDVVLLVSAGEEYVGVKKGDGAFGDDASFPRSNPDCSVVVLAQEAQVDNLALTQLETTARSLPGLIHAVGQPDLHPGTKHPIGAVFVSREWIHPPLIGGDIGCGMAWYKTMLSRAQVEGDKGRKVAENLRGLEGAWMGQGQRKAWLSGGRESFSAGEEWDRALGTIGAGNHFAEVQVLERSVDGALQEDDVVLLVHSGSRGYGGDILKRHTSAGRTSLHQDDPAATAYLEEHDRACEWARLNRDLIALRFLACLEPGDERWTLPGEASPDDVRGARTLVQGRKVVDIWHNNVSRTPWPPLPETQGQETVYIHRKGAAPTNVPLLPLPGSRATPTLLLAPTFSEGTAWGAHNALSLAHGAGRASSRAHAAKAVAKKYHGDANALLSPSSHGSSTPSHAADGLGEGVRGGAWVICEDKELVWEEAAEAYKDVHAVAADLVREGVAAFRGWARPRVCYKVRRE